MKKEIWKSIEGYEGIYEVSNLGRVKSLEREARIGNGCRIVKEKTLEQTIDGRGYLRVCLNKNGKHKNYKVHIIVFNHFCAERYSEEDIEKLKNGLLQRDHKDGDKLNNRADNFQLLTNRENTSKRSQQNGSKYNLPTGVTYDKRSGKYIAQITINGECIYLCRFNTPEESRETYQSALKEYGNTGKVVHSIKRRIRKYDLPKGVNLCVLKNGRIRYRARIKINGEEKHIGYCNTIPEASLAYQKALLKYKLLKVV